MRIIRGVQAEFIVLLMLMAYGNTWACFKCNDKGIVIMRSSTNAEGAFEDTISLSGQSDWYFCDCSIGKAKRAAYFKQSQDKVEPANPKVERAVVTPTANSLVNPSPDEPQKETQNSRTFPVDGKLVAVEASNATHEQDGAIAIHGTVSNKCGQSIKNVMIKFAFKRKDGAELFANQKIFRAVVQANEKKNFDLKFSDVPEGATYTVSSTFEYVDTPPESNAASKTEAVKNQSRKPGKLAEALAGNESVTGASSKVEKPSKEMRSADAQKLLKLARNFALNGLIEDARENLKTVIHDFADTPEAAEARDEIKKLK